jgi:hypothetical protein
MSIPIIKAGNEMHEKNCYILGRNGYYLKKENKLFSSVVPVEKISSLNKVTPKIEWQAEKIPYTIIKKAHEFFKTVYSSHKSEGVVLLKYKNDIWDIVVPDQVLSGAYVKYESSKFKGIVGSIHSHCMMHAFFSSIDDRDQASSDGIHIVLGKIMLNIPEIVTSIYVNGYQQEFNPSDLINDLPKFINPSHKWLDRVKVNKEYDIKYDDEMMGDLLEQKELEELDRLDLLDRIEETKCKKLLL